MPCFLYVLETSRIFMTRGQPCWNTECKDVKLNAHWWHVLSREDFPNAYPCRAQLVEYLAGTCEPLAGFNPWELGTGCGSTFL